MHSVSKRIIFNGIAGICGFVCTHLQREAARVRRLAAAAALADVRIVLAHRFVLQHLQLRVQSATNEEPAHKGIDINNLAPTQLEWYCSLRGDSTRRQCPNRRKSIRDKFHLFWETSRSFATVGLFGETTDNYIRPS